MTQDNEPTGGSPPQGDPKGSGATVPTSDLLAVKRKLDTAEADAQAKATQVEEQTTRADQLAAKVEELETEVGRKSADTLSQEELEAARKAQFDAQKKLKEDRAALQTEQATLQEQQGELQKKALATQYGVEASLFDGMTDPKEMELVAAKKVLETLASSKPADFDVSGGGGDAAPETPMERAGRILAEHDKSRGRTSSEGGSSFNSPDATS